MSIKIIPEKVARIDSHKTRKKITNTTYSSKELISKASHLKTTVEVANREFNKVNLPYLDDTHIVFYSPEKIILQSDKEILKSKIKELHDQFIEILNKKTLFSKLKKIEIVIDYSVKKKIKEPQINYDAKEAIRKIKKEICNKNSLN